MTGNPQLLPRQIKEEVDDGDRENQSESTEARLQRMGRKEKIQLILKMEEKMRESVEDLKSLVEDHKKWRADGKEWERAEKEMAEKIKVLENTISELKNEKESAQKEQNTSKNETTNVQTAKKKLPKKVTNPNDHQRRVEMRIKKRNEAYDAARRRNEQIATLTDRATWAESQKSELEEKLKMAETRISEANKYIETLKNNEKTEYESSLVLEDEIRRLKNELDETRISENALENRIEQMRKRHEETYNGFADAHFLHSKVNNDNERMKITLENRLNVIRKQNGEMRSMKAHIFGLREELEESKNQSTTQIEELREQLSTNSEELKISQKKAENLEKTLSDNQEKLENQEILIKLYKERENLNKQIQKFEPPREENGEPMRKIIKIELE